MPRYVLAIFMLLLSGGFASAARGQAFFGGAAFAFDPVISTVSSGVVLDAQATASHDLKYVTINTRATQSGLSALVPFQFQTPLTAGAPMGFVGGVIPAGATGGTATATPAAAANSPQLIERRAIAARSILSQRGVFLIRADK